MMLHDDAIPNKTQGVCLPLLSSQEIRYENPPAMDHPDSTPQLIILSGLEHNRWFSTLATQENHLRKCLFFIQCQCLGPQNQRSGLRGIGWGPGFSIF